MFTIVIVLLMCTLTISSSVLCVLMVEGMSVVVAVMLSLMSVMSPCMCVMNKQFELLTVFFESV